MKELTIQELKDSWKIIVAVVLLFSVGSLFLFASQPAPSAESPEKGFNRADVMFMNMMIVHHDQAIEMAELSENRTDNENILELSHNISEAQRAENQQMTEWLQELDYQRPRDGHRMAGMASEHEMQALRNASDREFDRKFSELMIEHHRGGIRMAQSFSQRGSYPELIEMEEQMIEAQQDEIGMMQDWREDWKQ